MLYILWSLDSAFSLEDIFVYLTSVYLHTFLLHFLGSILFLERGVTLVTFVLTSYLSSSPWLLEQILLYMLFMTAQAPTSHKWSAFSSVCSSLAASNSSLDLHCVVLASIYFPNSTISFPISFCPFKIFMPLFWWLQVLAKVPYCAKDLLLFQSVFSFWIDASGVSYILLTGSFYCCDYCTRLYCDRSLCCKNSFGYFAHSLCSYYFYLVFFSYIEWLNAYWYSSLFNIIYFCSFQPVFIACTFWSLSRAGRREWGSLQAKPLFCAFIKCPGPAHIPLARCVCFLELDISPCSVLRDECWWLSSTLLKYVRTSVSRLFLFFLFADFSCLSLILCKYSLNT